MIWYQGDANSEASAIIQTSTGVPNIQVWTYLRTWAQWGSAKNEPAIKTKLHELEEHQSPSGQAHGSLLFVWSMFCQPCRAYRVNSGAHSVSSNIAYIWGSGYCVMCMFNRPIRTVLPYSILYFVRNQMRPDKERSEEADISTDAAGSFC